MANIAVEIQPKMSGSQIFFTCKVLFVGGGWMRANILDVENASEEA